MKPAPAVWPALLGLGAQPLDIFCCTNAVNYTVAVKGVLAAAPRPAILLVETRRFTVRQVPGAWQWRLSVGSLRLLRLLAWVPLGTVHVPHQKVSRRFGPLMARAAAVAYLDDGLDTLRLQPRNFTLPVQPAGRVYHTFSDYPSLPPWLDAMQVQRCCTLASMVGLSALPPLELGPHEHVFIESPGLEPAAWVRALGLAADRVLVLRHPVPFKRGELPGACQAVVGNTVDTELTLLAARGRHFYFGETMAFFFALHSGVARHNTLWLQLGEAQWAGLHGLDRLQPVSLPGLRGRLGVLRPTA